MSIVPVIRGRRSIRCFNNKPVPRELILELLNDAVWAPNHGLREPWRFICVDTSASKEKVADLMLAAGKDMKRIKLLPAKAKELLKRKLVETPFQLIVVMKENRNAHKRKEDFAAVCCLIQNMQLLGWEREVGMLWSTMELIHLPEFSSGVGVGKDETIVGILHIGYFDETPRAGKRTPAEKKMTFL